MRNFEQTENRIRRSVTSAATELGIKASFTEGRRDSDIIVIRLRGKRQDMVFLSQQLKEIFPAVDIEVLQGKKHDGNIMTMIVTEPLSEQDAEDNMERRSKLRHKAQRNKVKTKKKSKQAEIQAKEEKVEKDPSSDSLVREAHEAAMARVPEEEQPIGYEYSKVIN